jgi:hypothetical protein
VDQLRSLYVGLKFGASYKICQRTAAYGLQPFLFDHIHATYHESFVSLAGQKRARAVEFATAAAIMGTVEVVFIPLDTLKIIAQTNASSLGGRSFLQIVQEEGFRLYRGASWTILRNFPGSFALFGGSALVKEKAFHLENYKDATLLQELVASTTGAVWSLTVSSPADVLKARVQRASLSSSGEGVKGREILRELLRKEGPWALFKGLNTKFMVVRGPGGDGGREGGRRSTRRSLLQCCHLFYRKVLTHCLLPFPPPSPYIFYPRFRCVPSWFLVSPSTIRL